MGLFGSRAPVAPPTAQRQDVTNAIKAAPPKEMERLSWAQPELNYLSKALPDDETVLAAASCSPATGGIIFGVIVLTDTRLVAVTGLRDKGGPKGRPIGSPSVLTFDFKSLYDFTFGPQGIRGIHGYLATLSVEGRGDVILQIAQDDGWAAAFLNRAQDQMNRFKLA